MTKIDDILDRLQKEQPVVDMPDELTERIMNSLPERRVNATGGLKAKKAWLYTTIGAAAASIMLLLALHQISPDIGGRQQPMVAQHTNVHSEKRIAPPDIKDAPAPLQATASAQSDKQNAYMETTAGIGNPHQQNAKNAKTVDAGERTHTPTVTKAAKKTKREIPDTLGNGIWTHEENVIRAMRILADCEATIAREHQQVRNEIIETTFHATPQRAGAILVTNEAGDYEVTRPNTITDI